MYAPPEDVVNGIFLFTITEPAREPFSRRNASQRLLVRKGPIVLTRRWPHLLPQILRK